MCAAAEMTRNGDKVVLVSHITQGNQEADAAQENVLQVLNKHFKCDLEHLQVKVYTRNKGDNHFPEDRETTQRTRSMLFLVLSSIVARRRGFRRVLFLAENGQFAIHLPLNSARVGPFSTHTADPEFLATFRDIIRLIMENTHFNIENPFLYKTKAEVVSLLKEPLRQKAKSSISCWMFSRKKKHCGECVPCISRRIALECNAIKFNEYAVDIFNKDLSKLPADHTGKRNLIDYIEFVSKFNDTGKLAEQNLPFEYPELFNPHIDQEKAIQMYKRLAKESFNIFRKYPKVMSII
jgi:7-cyano-7-deazaguanine synthase in queuosine biosynthesis